MVEIRHVLVNVLLIGIFVFSLITFGALTATQNNSNTSILNNPSFQTTYDEITGDLNASQGIAETQEKIQGNDTPRITGDLILQSTPRSVVAYRTSVKGVWSSTISMISNTLGVGDSTGAVIFFAFGAIYGITIVLLSWSAFKAGR